MCLQSLLLLNSVAWFACKNLLFLITRKTHFGIKFCSFSIFENITLMNSLLEQKIKYKI